jgi:hypothetical protein
MFVSMCVCVYVCECVYMLLSMCVCVCVCMRVHACEGSEHARMLASWYVGRIQGHDLKRMCMHTCVWSLMSGDTRLMEGMFACLCVYMYVCMRGNDTARSTEYQPPYMCTHACMYIPPRRKHVYIRICIHKHTLTPPDLPQVIIGKLNLVDLAGSEDSRKLAGASSNLRGPDAANFVSGSLGVLKEVIRAANQGSVGAGYADSRLTRIVKDSLVRCFVCMSVCVILMHLALGCSIC